MLTFRVEQIDITKGVRRSVSGCPLARAIRRVVGRGVSVWGRIDVREKVYSHSKASLAFMIAFDEKKRVRPCTLTLRERHNFPQSTRVKL